MFTVHETKAGRIHPIRTGVVEVDEMWRALSKEDKVPFKKQLLNITLLGISISSMWLILPRYRSSMLRAQALYSGLDINFPAMIRESSVVSTTGCGRDTVRTYDCGLEGRVADVAVWAHVLPLQFLLLQK
jgi:hypothetical protein